MTYLFHFEEKIHRKNLTRAEAIPLKFPRLLSQLLEHLSFRVKPYLERCWVCEAIFTVEQLQFVLGAPSLALRDLAEDHPPPEAPIEEPHIPASTVPIATDPLPASSEPPMPPILVDSARPSTSATPMETIIISSHDFLAIMTSVRTFAATSASFATTHAALAKRMACTEAILAQNNVVLTHDNVVLAQNNVVLAQNNAMLVQIQSHLGQPQIPPSPPGAASPFSTQPEAAIAPENPAPPTSPLDLLAAVVAVPSPTAPSPAVSPAAAHPAKDEDDIPPSTTI